MRWWIKRRGYETDLHEQNHKKVVKQHRMTIKFTPRLLWHEDNYVQEEEEARQSVGMTFGNRLLLLRLLSISRWN